jgi:TonB family protein
MTRTAVASLLLACTAPGIAGGQNAARATASCDSVLLAARVDSVAVTARAYLVSRDGTVLPPRARKLLLESILSHFTPPQPLHLPVFAAGPAPMRMLRPERLSDDTVPMREPVLYGVYDFTILRSGVVTQVLPSVRTMAPDFDERVAAAISAAAVDSIPAEVARGLGADAIQLELRISTGPADSRFRVPPVTLFSAIFPRLRLVDATTVGVKPLAAYPEDERDDGRDGEVLLRVVIDATGAALVPTLEIEHATSSAFALAAARTVARYHFAPAHVGKCNVPQVIEIPFWFSLRP